MKNFSLIATAFAMTCCSLGAKKNLRQVASEPVAVLVMYDNPRGRMCLIFLDNNLEIEGPSFEKMLHLLEFKPDTKSILHKHLKIDESENLKATIYKMASLHKEQYQGVPPSNVVLGDCETKKRLVDSLNSLLSNTEFVPSSLPELPIIEEESEEERRKRLLNDLNTSYPVECQGKEDVLGCAREIKARKK